MPDDLFMSRIKCGDNYVVIDEPRSDDHSCVQVVWFGEPRKAFAGPIEPIDKFEESVAWACEMAAQMVHPLYVIPMTGVQFLKTPEARRTLAGMTSQQHGELRHDIVTMLVGIMRDCHDRRVRTDAHAVLVDFGVIRG